MTDAENGELLEQRRLLHRRVQELEGQLSAQQQVLEALGQNAAELERLFTLSLDMLCIAGLDGYFKRLNPALQQTLGYSLDELKSRPFIELVHPEDREATLGELEKLSCGVCSVRFTNRYRTKDGTFRWLEWMASPDRRAGLVYSSAHDVTESRLAQEALQRSERRYRDLISAVTTYTYQVKLDHGVPVSTEHSWGCVSATGYTPEDYAADPLLWINMVHPEDRDMVREHVDRVLAGNDVSPLEHRIVHRDGSIRWVRSTIVQHRDGNGRPKRYDGLVEDITARKRAEQWFRAILELAPDAILITDRLGRIVLVNAQTERMFGYRRDELLGQPVEIVVPEQSREGHVRHRASYLADPRVRNMGSRGDLHARRKDGSEFLAEIALSPVRTDEGTLVFSVVRDVTERRRMERTLRENEVRLLAARRIQQFFLPRSDPEIPGFDIAGASYAAEFTAGDHFDYLPMAGSTLGVVVGDVSGHGFGPALLMVALRTHLRALIDHHDELDEILTDANRLLSREMDEEYFITLVIGQLDPSARTFRYVNAGHPAGYLLDRSGRVKAHLESTSMPLGILPDTVYPPAETLAMESGDLLLLLTDGILEAQTADGTQFGAERTLDLIRAHQSEPAKAIIEALYGAVRGFSDQGKIADDVTAVIVKSP